MLHSQQDLFHSPLEDILSRINAITRTSSASISEERKVRYAQYFTEGAVARQMASMLNVGVGAVIGDHGAGTGILGATVLAHCISAAAAADRPLALEAYEIDQLLHASFHDCLGEVIEYSRGLGVDKPRVRLGEDFTALAPALCEGRRWECLDAVILNPPYAKLHQQSPLARLMREHLVPTPNLYAVFIVLSALMLRAGGQMVAIVPRSFCSGPYFAAFRRWLRKMGSLDWFVRYKRRSNVFRGDNVLQENVIFRFTKGVPQAARIRISLCDSPDRPAEFESMVPTQDVLPAGQDMIFVPANVEELNALHQMVGLPYSLDDWSLKVNTGKVEDFRLKGFLHHRPPASSWAPVIYSQHFSRGDHQVDWQPTIAGKPACLEVAPTTRPKLLPRGNYVLVKRISANDDRTGRCHPCALTVDSALPGDQWGVDNHIQVLAGGPGSALSAAEAQYLAGYLRDETVDRVLRVVSGTTQLNRTDLMQIRFPRPRFA